MSDHSSDNYDPQFELLCRRIMLFFQVWVLLMSLGNNIQPKHRRLLPSSARDSSERSLNWTPTCRRCTNASVCVRYGNNNPDAKISSSVVATAGTPRNYHKKVIEN